MSKFYCNICEEDVTLQNGKCPKCKTDWMNIINGTNLENSKPINNNFQEDYLKENENKDEEDIDITEENIDNNINFFLSWASIGKNFMIVIGIIIAIISLVLIELTEGLSLILLVFSVVIIFAGIIFENSLKWKAYMLHTNVKKNNKK